MATLIGIEPTQIIAQSDFDLSENETGGSKATQSFIIRKRGLDNISVRNKFANGTYLYQLDPDCDDYWRFMQVVNIRNVTTVEGGFTRVTVDFAGYFTAEFDPTTGEPMPQPIFSLRGALVDRPLSDHWKWKALTDDEKFALGLLVNGDAVSSPGFNFVGTFDEAAGIFTGWQNDTGPIELTSDALEFAKLIAQGQTTFQSPTVVFSHMWESTAGIPELKKSDLGKISDPDGLDAVYVGRNWMLVSTDQTQTGTSGLIYKNQLEYLLSPPSTEWNAFLYA